MRAGSFYGTADCRVYCHYLDSRESVQNRNSDARHQGQLQSVGKMVYDEKLNIVKLIKNKIQKVA